MTNYSRIVGIAMGALALIMAFAILAKADAADMKGARVDAPVDYAPVEQGWTGPYIGAQAGYGVGVHEASADVSGEGQSYELFKLRGLSGDGVVGGVNGGFDVQRGNVVVGVLAGYTFTGIETTLDAFNGQFDASLEKGDEFYIGGRGGVLINPKTLAYVGLAWVQTDYELTLRGGGQTASLEKDYDGLKVLAGLESQIGRGISVKLEYQGDFYGDVKWVDENGVRATDTLDEHKVLFGVNYKLGLDPIFFGR